MSNFRGCGSLRGELDATGCAREGFDTVTGVKVDFGTAQGREARTLGRDSSFFTSFLTVDFVRVDAAEVRWPDFGETGRKRCVDFVTVRDSIFNSTLSFSFFLGAI
mmetsp:Transcript_13288/g.17374  ORF Transcript_13288/g.17374 Transcript_13288/m.17374 type:complete len:106 (+) Transcript_13288:280-597(+)